MKPLLRLLVIAATMYAIWSFIIDAAVPALLVTQEPVKQGVIFVLTVILSLGIAAVGVRFLKIIDISN